MGGVAACCSVSFVGIPHACRVVSAPGLLIQITKTELGVADMLSAPAWLAFPTFLWDDIVGLARDRLSCPVRRAQRHSRPGQLRRTRCPEWNMLQQEGLRAHRQPRKVCRSLMTSLAFGFEASARQPILDTCPCDDILTPPASVAVCDTAPCTSWPPSARLNNYWGFPATRRADG